CSARSSRRSASASRRHRPQPPTASRVARAGAPAPAPAIIQPRTWPRGFSMRSIAFCGLLLAALSASADELTIDRIYAAGSLSGPTPQKLKIAPDGSRVTFLRAKADDQTTYDLWEYNVHANATRLLVDSTALAPHEAELSDAEKARRERARI